MSSATQWTPSSGGWRNPVRELDGIDRILSELGALQAALRPQHGLFQKAKTEFRDALLAPLLMFYTGLFGGLTAAAVVYALKGGLATTAITAGGAFAAAIALALPLLVRPRVWRARASEQAAAGALREVILEQEKHSGVGRLYHGLQALPQSPSYSHYGWPCAYGEWKASVNRNQPFNSIHGTPESWYPQLVSEMIAGYSELRVRIATITPH